jgi:hypothetical protein
MSTTALDGAPATWRDARRGAGSDANFRAEPEAQVSLVSSSEEIGALQTPMAGQAARITRREAVRGGIAERNRSDGISEEAHATPLERALALYQLGQTSYALDAFAHPLIETLLSGDASAVDEMLGAVRGRIAALMLNGHGQELSRDFHELEVWLAAVTLTRKIDSQLHERGALVQDLYAALTASNHVDKQALLKVIF